MTTARRPSPTTCTRVTKCSARCERKKLARNERSCLSPTKRPSRSVCPGTVSVARAAGSRRAAYPSTRTDAILDSTLARGQQLRRMPRSTCEDVERHAVNALAAQLVRALARVREQPAVVQGGLRGRAAGRCTWDAGSTRSAREHLQQRDLSFSSATRVRASVTGGLA